MKILILADPASTHTMKWVSALSERGIQIYLFGLNSFDTNLYSYPNINFYSLNLNNKIRFGNETSFSKLIYLKAINQIKKIIGEIHPNILHAHYATSYGLLGALSNFHPYVISIWGSDVLSFPNHSFFHKEILKFNLDKSSRILATSHYLASKTSNFTNKKIQITPFGVDINKFNSFYTNKHFKDGDIIIGTVKSLEKIYGIDTLIKSFSIVKKRNKNLPLKLLIVGSGSEENKLKSLAKELLEENDYLFSGYISHDIVSTYHNMIDISVFLSNQESFGVSVIEAMACRKPVVVTGVGGLKEIVDDGQNGFIVSPNKSEEAAKAIENLVLDLELRISFGKNGREKVKSYYDWNKCVDLMINIYKDILQNYNN